MLERLTNSDKNDIIIPLEVSMFLHLGNDVYVKQKDIVMICNLDTASVSKNTQIYLKKCEENGLVETICTDIPKSFVLVSQRTKGLKSMAKEKKKVLKNNKDKIYLTNISSVTLLKRSSNGLELN